MAVNSQVLRLALWEHWRQEEDTNGLKLRSVRVKRFISWEEDRITLQRAVSRLQHTLAPIWDLPFLDCSSALLRQQFPLYNRAGVCLNGRALA